MLFATVVFAAEPATAKQLIDKTKGLGDWVKNELFGTIGLFGFLISAGLVIFGNSAGLKRIGLVLVVLCLVAAYDIIWQTLTGFFK